MMTTKHESSAVRRKEIAQAALKVIAERGVQHLTTRAIAENTGISEGGIFRHFKSKKEIAMAALDHLEQLLEIPDDLLKTDPIQALESFFKSRAHLVGGAALGHLVFSEQLIHVAGEEGRQKVAGWRKANSDFLLKLLSAVHREGGLRHGLPPAVVLPIVQGAMLVIFAERGINGPLPNLDAKVDGLWASLQTLIIATAE